MYISVGKSYLAWFFFFSELVIIKKRSIPVELPLQDWGMSTCHGIHFLPSYDRKEVFKINVSIFALKHKGFVGEEIRVNPSDTESRRDGVEEGTISWNEQESIVRKGRSWSKAAPSPEVVSTLSNKEAKIWMHFRKKQIKTQEKNWDVRRVIIKKLLCE